MVDHILELKRWLLVAVLKKETMVSLAENAVRVSYAKREPLKLKLMFTRGKQQTSASNWDKSAKPTG